MYAGLNIFLSLSVWEKLWGEGGPDVTRSIAELEIWHPSDKQRWEGRGRSWGQPGLGRGHAEEQGELWGFHLVSAW